MNDSKLTTLRLVQFNVENLFLYMDLYNGQNLTQLSEAQWGQLSTSVTPNKPLRKVLGLAEAIRDLNPDVLMLNEVGGVESLENLNNHFLNNDYIVYLKEGNSKRGIDVGYLVKKSLPFKALLISHKDRPINFLYPHEKATESGGKSHYFSRDVAELRLFKPGSKSPSLILLLTHLKSKLDSDGIDKGGQLRRAAELKTLVNIYNEVRAESKEKPFVVVAGDFNGIASREKMEPEFQPLYEQTDLVEAFSAAEVPLEKRFTQVQITPSGRQLFIQFDYQFVSPELAECIDKENTFVYHFKSELGQTAPFPRNMEERSNLISDHYPVVLTVKI